MAKDVIKVGFAHQQIVKNAIKNFHCINLTFVNQGTQDVVIDGIITLAPNDSITYPGYDPYESNETAFNIVFTNDRAAGCKLVAIVKNRL